MIKIRIGLNKNPTEAEIIAYFTEGFKASKDFESSGINVSGTERNYGMYFYIHSKTHVIGFLNSSKDKNDVKSYTSHLTLGTDHDDSVLYIEDSGGAYLKANKRNLILKKHAMGLVIKLANNGFLDTSTSDFEPLPDDFVGGYSREDLLSTWEDYN